MASSKTILCDYCTEGKLQAIKTCLECRVSFCTTHLMPHKSVEKLKKHKLIDPVETLEDYICKKHERPLEMFCRDDQICVCHSCLMGDHKTHIITSIEEEVQVKKSQLGETQADIQKMIQKRLNKVQELKSTVELSKTNTEKEKADIVEAFNALMLCIERNQAELLKIMEEKQKAAERQTEEFIRHLQSEISELKKRTTELEQLMHSDEHLHLLQIYPSLGGSLPGSNWSDVGVEFYLNVETLKRALPQLQKSLNEEMERVPDIKLKRIRQHAVDVTLDPETGNPALILSDDGKQVSHGDLRQKLPANVKRFDFSPCIMGKQGFSSGRFYYEVQVRGKTKWDIGVAWESVKRKGEITYSTENGFWLLCLRNGSEYKACDSPPVPLSLTKAPQRVGVFVNYEEGLVSFYNVDTKSLIYSFTGQTFGEKIFPFFSPSLNNGGKNSAPLIITPVQ
ncbi:zinc finger protein RFP-like isoform X2 [Silurus meridionalis]|nr:zinc finger protein RFP-like isoform X2 [Silurus meridionalis]XP_046706976.1 zinc finger protein RFP-like isoform X2 [Silurus meridionalis]XP_046706977.1 zinc finger protein RFP-like isoform X2 [Silurus meridionalis]XP_046706978.1 zinc finger protein RFP-like isoform X2 [Silurus meridionalis]XP_046706979.1 zinc finger protein RFP-like isoform X2 [Silurus meridionalis]